MTSKVLMNRYHLQEKIGYGGMGQVYQGWDSLLNRAVAIKIMPSYDEQIKERYRREAASLAALSHPNIIKIYDVGEEAGVIFLVMEYVQGPTLQEIIKAKAPLQLNEGLRIMQKVMAGLGEVHRKGIIHRDLKPQNILLTNQGQVKLCDFGIAKVGTLETLTVTGMALGTVQYMAPEQLMGGDVTPASDIYAVGVILYEMFTGSLPFNGKNIGEIAQKHFNVNPPPLSVLNSNIDKNLSLLVAKCLAKKPKDRFQRVEEIQYLIDGIIEGNLKETVFLGLSRQPTLQQPINQSFKESKPLNKLLYKLLYKLLRKFPLKKILSLAILVFLLIFGMHNLEPWLENKSQEYLKQKNISGLPSNSKQRTVKNEVEKVKNSLQTLQKDFQQGDHKVINDNLQQWGKKILTDKEILQKLEEKLNREYSNYLKKDSLKTAQPKLNLRDYTKQKENLQKFYEQLYLEYLKDYQDYQGKKAKRKHDD